VTGDAPTEFGLYDLNFASFETTTTTTTKITSTYTIAHAHTHTRSAVGAASSAVLPTLLVERMHSTPHSRSLLLCWPACDLPITKAPTRFPTKAPDLCAGKKMMKGTANQCKMKTKMT
jgi:hypothetical protein